MGPRITTPRRPDVVRVGVAAPASVEPKASAASVTAMTRMRTRVTAHARSRVSRVVASVTFYKGEYRWTPLLGGGLLRLRSLLGVGVLATGLLTAVGATPAGSTPAKHNPRFTEAVAFDVSKPLRVLAKTEKASARNNTVRMSPERGATVQDAGFLGDAAVQATSPAATAAIGARSPTSKAWASRTTSPRWPAA